MNNEVTSNAIANLYIKMKSSLELHPPSFTKTDTCDPYYACFTRYMTWIVSNENFSTALCLLFVPSCFLLCFLAPLVIEG